MRIENRTGIGIEEGIAIRTVINYRNRSVYKIKAFILSTRAGPRTEVDFNSDPALGPGPAFDSDFGTPESCF
ncbi:hypothetical protein EVAR_97654_1 [Eumeta japonica]|uniref:Uncharacterized protein n=1 Tax=Eumeta variegata TaxID=151549 RepID=A0A4C1WX50_EUMVA|nr:hypothetical protein EVAR_97654_1 [Eumeta japonica]